MLWALRAVMKHWNKLARDGEPSYSEMTFLIYRDQRDLSTRLGIGVVKSNPDPDSASQTSPANEIIFPANEKDLPPNDRTLDTTAIPGNALNSSLGAEMIDVEVDVEGFGDPVCSDVQFYETNLDAMIQLAERDATDPVGDGISLYVKGERPTGLTFTYQVGSVSEEEAAAGTLKVRHAIYGIVRMSRVMEELGEALRFHTFAAYIKDTDTGKVLGVIKMFEGGGSPEATEK